MPLIAKNGILYDENGIACGFACSRPAWTHCDVKDCKKKVEALCDFMLDTMIGEKTCDFQLCYKHRQTVAPNKDYCPKHNLEVIEGARETR